MSMKVSYIEAERRVKKINPNLSIEESSYTAFKTKCRIFDSSVGDFFECSPSTLFHGKQKGHPKLNIRPKISIEEAQLRVDSKMIGYTIIPETYIGTRYPFYVKENTSSKVVKINTINKYPGLKEISYRRTAENNRVPIEEAKSRLNKVAPHLKLIESTYVEMSSQCSFIDTRCEEEFKTLPFLILSGHTKGTPSLTKKQRQESCLVKYGVKNASQNKEIMLKQARSSNKSIVLVHWKTGEEIVCIAGYEKAVVEYWNFNKINYEWQPMTFICSTGKRYFVDAYLPDNNLYIEIKGFFRKDALEKWQEFQLAYPNSELWDKAKLKELGIM